MLRDHTIVCLIEHFAPMRCDITHDKNAYEIDFNRGWADVKGIPSTSLMIMCNTQVQYTSSAKTLTQITHNGIS